MVELDDIIDLNSFESSKTSCMMSFVTPEDHLITSAEAAKLAGVGATAIKRWADSGLLPCVKTVGGHRRFRRSDVERLVRRADDWQDWLDLLVRGTDVHVVHARLLEERGRRGAWHEVADALGGLLTEIGRRWQAGELSVLEEHLASGRLQRALAAVSDTLPVSPLAPRALLATAEGDEHTVGISLAELTLREAGWQTESAGSRTPVGEIVERLGRGGVRMVALSASVSSADEARLKAEVDALAGVCRSNGVELVMGGQGAWPSHPSHGVRFATLGEFFHHARQLRDREMARA